MERREKGIPFDDDKWAGIVNRLEEYGVDVAPWRAL
jgi:hypothetical protein